MSGLCWLPPAGKTPQGLLQRIRPAESRISRLAVETPGLFIAFDLLMRNGIDLAGMKLSDRRRELEDFAKKVFRAKSNIPVRPKFVVEVSYDHFSGGRFRHRMTIIRWRPDKKPGQCTTEQLKTSGKGIRL